MNMLDWDKTQYTQFGEMVQEAMRLLSPFTSRNTQNGERKRRGKEGGEVRGKLLLFIYLFIFYLFIYFFYLFIFYLI